MPSAYYLWTFAYAASAAVLAAAAAWWVAPNAPQGMLISAMSAATLVIAARNSYADRRELRVRLEYDRAQTWPIQVWVFNHGKLPNRAKRVGVAKEPDGAPMVSVHWSAPWGPAEGYDIPHGHEAHYGGTLDDVWTAIGNEVVAERLANFFLPQWVFAEDPFGERAWQPMPPELVEDLERRWRETTGRGPDAD